MNDETKILANQAIEENVQDTTARQIIRYVMECEINGFDTIRPTNKHIAEKYGWSLETVRVAISKAKKSQFITTTGRNKSRTFELNVQFLKGKMGEIKAKKPLNRSAFVLEELSEVADLPNTLPNGLPNTLPNTLPNNLPNAEQGANNNSNNNSNNNNVSVATKDGDAPHYQLAKRLQKWILRNKPNRKIDPNWLENWGRQIRLMHENDGRTWEQIKNAIDWSQQDEFWKINILSGEKLRKQYDRLDDEARRKNKVDPNLALWTQIENATPQDLLKHMKGEL